METRENEHITQNLFDVFDSNDNFQILRGVEPNLILEYTPIICPEVPSNEPKTKKQNDCETRRALSIGTKQMLSKIVFDHKEKMEKANKK